MEKEDTIQQALKEKYEYMTTKEFNELNDFDEKTKAGFLQYVLGLETCKTKGDVVEMLVDIYNKGFKAGQQEQKKKFDDLQKQFEHLYKLKEEQKKKFEEILDDVDIELLFTDIKDKEGNKAELSDELMEIIRLWWESKSEELKQKLGEIK